MRRALLVLTLALLFSRPLFAAADGMPARSEPRDDSADKKDHPADLDGDDDDDRDDARKPAPGEAWSLDLTVHDVGLGLGNSQHIDGLRLNFRDYSPGIVHGLNLTIWTPAHNAGGSVAGLSLGLPLTGSGDVRGVALGLGVEATRSLDGLVIAPLGAGAGGDIHGLVLSGIGAGSGGDISGLSIAGIGLGAGGDLNGISIGGIGAGAGGDMTGLVLGGVGAGAGGQIRGIAIGGLGIGAGKGIDGLAIGGLGVGSGGDLRGLAIGGLGVGCGGTLTGLAIAGIGIGAPHIVGMTLSPAAGGKEVTGLVVAPAFFDLQRDGDFTGVSISAVNRILGEQHGLVIGIVNYTSDLHGVQLGLINWAGNNRGGLKLLPIANAHFD